MFMHTDAQSSTSAGHGGILALSSDVQRSTTLQGALAVLTLAASMLVGACASPASPTAPAAALGPGAGDVPSSSVRLTVRVLTRTQEAPLPGAVVTVDGTTSKVDAAGTCEFNVRPGAMANVDVSAVGFAPLGASGILQNDERWTFYLEPIGGSQSAVVSAPGLVQRSRD